ncbi:hypothetical protein CIPAW_02G074900 [Carya illinoinensis]|uniref:RPW8 domain-containing protein n=1 Tax=Carya illinoinensis TaxID=32201 RepID=A0A8T1RDQ4_CARIL|nr:hypothetical protein CIPAW_02G074900 [Carya illinoinensis]
MASLVVANAALGGAVEKVFSLLYEAIRDVINKTHMYESILEQLKDTLDVMRPLLEKMLLSIRELDLPEERTKRLIQRMEKGEKRVRKYSQLPWWKYLMRFHYANKLLPLEMDLRGFFNVELPAWNAMNVLESVKGINDIPERLSLTRLDSVASCAVPRFWDFVIGLDVPLKELKMQLLRVDMSMLVLTAPGGCGKTTLVKMLGHDDHIKGIFKENIFFVPVSKTPNLKIIIQKLLGKDDRSPVFQSDEDAIDQLEQMLLAKQNKPILLILDDVWSRSESLLEKFAFPLPNYKILVTSRTAFPRFRFTYKLKPLNDDDAMELFHHSAGLQDGGSSYIPDGEMVKKIVKGCGGFPLALKVVGKSLCGQSATTWHLRSGEMLLECLQSSLEFKGNEMILRECFMDLGSFLEDQKIPVAALIDMWSELYELVEDGIHVIANLHEINTRNLANLVVTRQDASLVGSHCNEDFVLQHDLLRELAIHQCSQEPIEQRKRLIIDINGNNIPKWWMEQRLQPINAQLLSISTDETFSSSWCNLLPAQVKALIVTNYGFFPAELGNIQLLGSLPNLKRIMLQKVSIPSIFKTPPPLRNLEKISLFMCNIDQNFRNFSIEISNAYLKKLSITNCHKLFALPIEIKELKGLELPESVTSLQNLRILDISDCLSISKLPKHIGKLRNLNEIHMTGCLRLRNPLPPSTMDLEKLKRIVCDKERANLWELIQEFRMDGTRIEIRIAEKDINLNWLANRF